MTDSREFPVKDIVSNPQYHRQVACKVSIRRLKEFVLNELARDNPLREIVLGESDLLDPAEFLVKIDVWLRLSKLGHLRAPSAGSRPKGE